MKKSENKRSAGSESQRNVFPTIAHYIATMEAIKQVQIPENGEVETSLFKKVLETCVSRDVQLI